MGWIFDFTARFLAVICRVFGIAIFGVLFAVYVPIGYEWVLEQAPITYLVVGAQALVIGLLLEVLPSFAEPARRKRKAEGIPSASPLLR